MRTQTCNVVLNGREVVVPRARLGLFLRLEEIYGQLADHVLHRDSGACVSVIIEYVEMAIGEKLVDPDKMDWRPLFFGFLRIKRMNSLEPVVPFLQGIATSAGEDFWTYPGRVGVLWIHMLASRYHWSRAEIENLFPEEAATFIQEIMYDEFLTKEWEYSLSELAYEPQKDGKSRYRPFPRPSWIGSKKPKKVKMLKKLIPAGTIIDLSGVTLDQLDD